MSKATQYEEAVAEGQRILKAQERAEARGWELAELCHRWTFGKEAGTTARDAKAKAEGRVTSARFAEDLGRQKFGTQAVGQYRRAWSMFGDPSKRLRWSDGTELSFGDHLAIRSQKGLQRGNWDKIISEAERGGTTLAWHLWQERATAQAEAKAEAGTITRAASDPDTIKGLPVETKVKIAKTLLADDETRTKAAPEIDRAGKANWEDDFRTKVARKTGGKPTDVPLPGDLPKPDKDPHVGDALAVAEHVMRAEVEIDKARTIVARLDAAGAGVFGDTPSGAMALECLEPLIKSAQALEAALLGKASEDDLARLLGGAL